MTVQKINEIMLGKKKIRRKKNEKEKRKRKNKRETRDNQGKGRAFTEYLLMIAYKILLYDNNAEAEAVMSNSF